MFAKVFVRHSRGLYRESGNLIVLIFNYPKDSMIPPDIESIKVLIYLLTPG